MPIQLNDIFSYGDAKFKIVKIATSNDIDKLDERINTLDTITDTLNERLTTAENNIQTKASLNIATTSSNGLMSYNDKKRLNTIASTSYGSTASFSKIKVNINSATAWMLIFTVTIYQGYRATKVMISGYNYGVNHWYSPNAVILGDTAKSTIKVYFGYDANWKLWVGFDGGSYTGITIDSVTNGYQQINDFSNLFIISNVSSLSTVQTTVTAISPY